MHKAEEQATHRVQPQGRRELTAQALGRERTADSLSLRLMTAKEGASETAVLSVRGDIDLVSAPTLREALLPVLERGTGAVVIDLSEVPFMDSTGVHVLVNVLRKLEPQGRRLAIACPEDSPVHKLLALVGVLDSLTVHGSRRGAVIGGDDRVRPQPTVDRATRCFAGPRRRHPSFTAIPRPRGG